MTPAPSLDEIRRARSWLIEVTRPVAPVTEFVRDSENAVVAARAIYDGKAPAVVLSAVVRDRSTRPGAPPAGGRLLVPEDDDWPPLGDLSPLGLWLKGPASLRRLTARAIVVTGTGTPDRDASRAARRFGYGLAREGVTVVSTARYGVDGEVLRAALAARGPAIAVLAHGVDQPYPAGHQDLLRAVADGGGLVVSALRLGALPSAANAAVSADIAAAFGAAVVLVDAEPEGQEQAIAAKASALGRNVHRIAKPPPHRGMERFGPIADRVAQGIGHAQAARPAHPKEGNDHEPNPDVQGGVAPRGSQDDEADSASVSRRAVQRHLALVS